MSRLSAPHQPKQATNRRQLRRERATERRVSRAVARCPQPCERCGAPLVEGTQGIAVYECQSCGALFDKHLGHVARPLLTESDL